MTVSEEHEFFMSEAVKEAQIGIRARHGGPFGCVMVKNGQIVGRGHLKPLIFPDVFFIPRQSRARCV